MIGKATVAVVVLFGVFAIIASRVPSEWAMLAVGAAAFFSLFGFLGFLAWFAKNHPDLAATEGTTYVQSRQLTLGAKNLPSPPIAELIPDPQNPTLFKPAGAE